MIVIDLHGHVEGCLKCSPFKLCDRGRDIASSASTALADTKISVRRMGRA